MPDPALPVDDARRVEDACSAFLDNIRLQEQRDNRDTVLFEQGGRLSVVVHHRIETFYVLARHLLDTMAPSVPALAPSLPTESLTERDLHVRLEQGPPTFTASVWSASGDAGMTPGELGVETLTLREWMDRLDEYLSEVRDYLEASRA